MKPPFILVTANAGTDMPAEISIRGVIGRYWNSETYSIGDTESDVLDELKTIPAGKKINVRINSIGGEVAYCLGCYNALAGRAADVTTYNCGYACSSASILMLAGSKRVSPKSSIWMIHRAAANTSGNTKDKLKDSEMLQKHDDMMASLYAKHAGGTPQEWMDKMDAETWMTGEEAVQMKLATDGDGEMEQAAGEVDDQSKKVIATFKHIPDNLKSRLTITAKANLPMPQPTKQSMKKIIDALVAAGFTVGADATEDAISLVISRDVAPIKAENQKHIDARKSRVTTLLDAAVADKTITEARKSGLLAFGTANAEGEAEVMAQIADIRTAKAATNRRGANPVPRGEEAGDTIESLLAEQAEAIKEKDSDTLAQINAKLAAKRGRDKIFEPYEERPVYHN